MAFDQACGRVLRTLERLAVDGYEVQQIAADSAAQVRRELERELADVRGRCDRLEITVARLEGAVAGLQNAVSFHGGVLGNLRSDQHNHMGEA
jgi:hypothetical protein